jgi:hypothetical protein
LNNGTDCSLEDDFFTVELFFVDLFFAMTHKPTFFY